MHVICNKQLLVEAVSNVSRAVSSRNTLAALEGILLKTAAGTISLTGYDLELAITTEIEADIREQGEIVLPAKLFLDMIRRMPSEQVSIKTDEKMLTIIKGDVTEYTILGIPASEFPELPSISQTTGLNLPQRILKNMIGQTLFAVSTSDSKPVHTGSLFDIRGGELYVVSVDGYRLAMRKEPTGYQEDLMFIVPGKSLSEVAKLLKEEDADVELTVSKRHIIFQIGSYHVVSRLLEGEYIDTDGLLGSIRNQFTVLTGVQELRKALDSASCVDSDGKTCLRFEGQRLTFRCESEHGNTAVPLDVIPLTGMPQGEYWYMSRQLLSCLKSLAGTVTLGIAQDGMLTLETENAYYLQTGVRPGAAGKKEKKKPVKKAA